MKWTQYFLGGSRRFELGDYRKFKGLIESKGRVVGTKTTNGAIYGVALVIAATEALTRPLIPEAV